MGVVNVYGLGGGLWEIGSPMEGWFDLITPQSRFDPPKTKNVKRYLMNEKDRARNFIDFSTCPPTGPLALQRIGRPSVSQQAYIEN